ncbi:polysaccharide deacetylase family protein [Polyangium sp. y55x31]|uniref:polysaccharide deacetylase family protein n=1 Tax=Polyangium sp. y55x31 TaxID=3042688 RepID=UPI00248210EE|nr:polysaccharide deacetylase family protein [Polyangium sp. y55x31]MDI1476119.1 polysaccharide deacetylase family protein [Polyangium sp. y55x31]
MAERTRFGALSVDLDGISHYHQIHGLAPLADEAVALHAVYDIALARMADFAGAHDLPLTLFAIGADLARPESAAKLADLAARGHVVENHSFSHRYDFTRASPEEIRRDIAAGQDAIERATGRRPVGFRAPGYTVTDVVLDALEELGLRFDSSVFPCPAYYGAKALVMAAMRVVGRTSASVLDTPRVLAAPTRPYRPGKPLFRPGNRALVELPIQVTPGLRLPFIGTSIALAGPRVARVLTAQCADEPLVNLELHGIDFLDASDGLAHLVPHQRELRIPLARRLDALSAAIDVLAKRGAKFVTLEEAARAIA